ARAHTPPPPAPHPQRRPNTTPPDVAPASPVRANQIMRACFGLGGGRLMSSLAELTRPFAGRAHGVDECAAHTGVLQLPESFDRGPAGAGHDVLEGSGMKAGFEQELGAAQEGLSRQLERDVARQPLRDPAVAERLDEEKGI